MTETMIDSEEVARLLGVKETTVRRLARKGDMPTPARPGGHVMRWSPETIKAWIAAGCPTVKAQKKVAG